MLTPLLTDLEALSVAQFVRTSLWAYPLLEIVHIAGLGALFGSLLTLELRVLGMQPIVMLQGMARITLRVAVGGFLVAAASGGLMLVSRATEIATTPAFLVKLALIAAAGVNAVMFHRRRSLTREDGTARAQALLSIALWLGVIAAGRLIAYA